MNLPQKTRENTLLYWIAGAFLLFSCIRAGLLFVEYYGLDSIFHDFRWRWQECAYLLKGINPMDVIHHHVPADPNIGPLGAVAGTVPWAYIMGNLFVWGFLPYNIALFFGFGIYPVVVMITAIVIYRHISEKTDNAYGFLAAALLLICPYWPHGYIQAANYGLSCVCFIVIMTMILDRHPVLAGVLLALASMKPQLAFLFYVALFFQGRWKTLSIASTIVLASWGLASLMAGVSPLVMFFQMAEQGANYFTAEGGFLWSSYGVFTFLVDRGLITSSQCLLYSGILGAALVSASSLFFVRTGLLKGNELLYFAVPAVISRMWSYDSVSDRPVLMLLVMAYLLCLYRSRMSVAVRVSSIAFVVAVYFFNGNAIVSGTNKILTFIMQKTGFNMLEHVIWFNNFFLYAGLLVFLLIVVVVIAWRQLRASREQSRAMAE